MLLEGRVAVVTGAGSGIGREIAALRRPRARESPPSTVSDAGEQLVEDLGRPAPDRSSSR